MSSISLARIRNQSLEFGVGCLYGAKLVSRQGSLNATLTVDGPRSDAPIEEHEYTKHHMNVAEAS